MSSIFPFYTAKREPTAENQFGEILHDALGRIDYTAGGEVPE